MSKASNTSKFKLPLRAKTKPSSMLKICDEHAGTVAECEDFPNQPVVQAACGALKKRIGKAAKTLTDLVNHDAARVVLEGARDQEFLLLRIDHNALVASINTAAAGDKQAGLAWGAKLVTLTTLPPSSDPPVNPRLGKTKLSGEVVARCTSDKAAICYLFQSGPDPLNPDAWPAPVIEGGVKHVYSGLAVGTKIYVRIAIQRRGTGQGAWSHVMAIVVS
jgi:hypothetical protein